MINMSYCRFHNTNLALDECLTAIEDNKIESKEELGKAKVMFENFLEFCIDQGIIESYDTDQINNVLKEAYINESE